MADATLRMIRDCRSAVGARVAQAELQFGTAARAGSQAADAVARADAGLAAAVADWHDRLRGDFDPMLGASQARLVQDRADAARIAGDRQVEADQAHAAAAAVWRSEDARRRALEEADAIARRRDRRRTEERLLSRLDDRETSKWIRA